MALWYWHGAWMLVELAFVAAFIWLIWNFFSSKSDSLMILKARYAKGAITKKEFDRMKRELGD